MNCAECKHSFMEDWETKRAIRCGKPGERYGRVTHVIPAGMDPACAGAEAPSWCEEVQSDDGEA